MHYISRFLSVQFLDIAHVPQCESNFFPNLLGNLFAALLPNLTHLCLTGRHLYVGNWLHSALVDKFQQLELVGFLVGTLVGVDDKVI